ncbi:hypothetical protein VNI00_013346 [Paramarasmius palmivorus]|uniref:Uncharacterized protein n=1 Tax=Paramarasmius palmivorus TaxID=297713 RepID=A0AAW0BZD8_9AGAR
MPPKPKFKPLKKYTQPSDEKFIVVSKPWIHISKSAFIYAIGGWLECASGTRPLAIYHMGVNNARNYIIVSLPSSVDITQLLGSHRPSEFIKDDPQHAKLKATEDDSWIYEYNYGAHGDPSESASSLSIIERKTEILLEQWDMSIPEHGPVESSPFKRGEDYPPPRLCPPVPGFHCEVARRIPTNILEKLQAREEQVLAEKQAAQAAAAAEAARLAEEQRSLLRPSNVQPPDSTMFTPYVPPSHLYPKPNGGIVQVPQDTPEPSTSDPQIGKIGKMDPYEEDEAANFLLQSGPPIKQEDTTQHEHTLFVHEARIKEENTSNTFPAIPTQDATAQPTVKPEPAPPSEELCRLHETYMALQGNSRHRSPAIKPEPVDNPLLGNPNPDDTTTRGLNCRIKSEPAEVPLSQSAPTSASIKQEPRADSASSSQPDIKKEEEKYMASNPSAPSWRRRRERNIDAVFGDDPTPSTTTNLSGPPVRQESPAVKSEHRAGQLPSSSTTHPKIKEEETSMHAPSGSRASVSASAWGRKRERNSDAVYGNTNPHHARSGPHTKNERYTGSVKREYDDCVQIDDLYHINLQMVYGLPPSLSQSQMAQEDWTDIQETAVAMVIIHGGTLILKKKANRLLLGLLLLPNSSFILTDGRKRVKREY